MLFSTLLITTSLLLANDKSEVVDVVNKHWEYQNTKDWKKYAGTFHSGGNMNGDEIPSKRRTGRRFTYC